MVTEKVSQGNQSQGWSCTEAGVIDRPIVHGSESGLQVHGWVIHSYEQFECTVKLERHWYMAEPMMWSWAHESPGDIKMQILIQRIKGRI